MAVNSTTSVDVNTLTPFKQFIMTLGILPTSYLASMSYAELVMWFCNFLQEDVIPTVNNNAEALQELVDYLNNLDLQEYVDTKLDKMAESGELQEIIAEYLQSKAIFVFDSISDLKEATNLIAGSYAQLIGSSSANDGVSQLFLIETAGGSEVDGTDCFVLDSGLIARRVKEKYTLPLIPTMESNEIVKNLTMTNANTGSGTAGISFTNQDNVTVEHSNISGGYWSVRIGNENDNSDTTNIKMINNTLTSPHGLSLRHRTGSSTGGGHVLALNKVSNTSSNPGIESWAKEDLMLFNRIKNISGNVGGTGGITIGAKPNQMALGNYIENYAYGTEIGNSNLNIISNQFIKNCTRGIVCSSDGTQDVLISNCIIQIPANGYGIYLRSGQHVSIDNCIIIYGDSVGDYNDSSSRSGYGIYSDTYQKNVNISNCTFINIANVSLSITSSIVGCKFINCGINCGAINQHFIGCQFIDVASISIGGSSGKKVYFDDCKFVRSSDNSANAYILNGRGNTTPGIVELNNCYAENCIINSMYSNATVGSDKRFLAQKINGIYYTFNKAQLSNIKSDFEGMGYTLEKGDKIIDNYNHKVWIVMTQDRQISYQSAVPNTGTFVKGDKIYNNLSSTSTVEYWLCTTSGTFGDTDPVFTAHNI